MAQLAQIIDVTRSYYPCDPNAFAENMIDTGKEDSPEKPAPVLAMEGYNFLPTSYGYRSFFGINQKLNILPLTSRCDKVLLYQDATYTNVLVALCEDGIWVARTDVAGLAWVHEISLPLPDTGSYLMWTYCILDNDLYMYRQGAGAIYKIENSPSVNSVNNYPVISVPTITEATHDSNPSTQTYTVYVATLSGTTYASSTGGVASTPVQADSNYHPYGPNSTQTLTFTWADSPAIRVNDGAGNYAVWIRVYFSFDGHNIITYRDVQVPVSNVLPNNTLTTPAFNVPATTLAGGFPDPSSVNTQVSGAVTSFTPSFLNMTGQIGVFRAGGRLGMWDSDNSVSYSSAEDYTNFTPSITTMAGNNQFLNVKGRIVLCKENADGFIVYCTASIFAVIENFNDGNLWDTDPLNSKTGISSHRQVATGTTEDDHYVWTHTGMYHIGNYNALSRKHGFEQIMIDTSDFIRELNLPVHLDCLMGRYLFIKLLTSEYVDGYVSHQAWVNPPTNLLLINGEVWSGDLNALPVNISGYQWSVLFNQLLEGNTLAGQDLIVNSSVYTGNPLDTYSFTWTVYDAFGNIIP